MVAKISVIPGFLFPTSVRAGMRRIGVSDFDRSMSRLAGSNGLVHWIEPGDFSNGVIPDRASSARFTSGGGTADPVATNINGQPAAGFTNGATRSLTGDAPKLDGSFSVIMAWSFASGDIINANRNLWSSGSALSSLPSARINNALNGDGNPFVLWSKNSNDLDSVAFVRTPGLYIDVFSYDSATKAAKLLDKTGAVVVSGTWTTDPPGGSPWTVGGALSNPTFSMQGKIGRTLIFNQALHLAGNADLLSGLLSLMRADYGV